jgi:hypothetical protein
LAVPDPALVDTVCDPYEMLVPYSTYHFVVTPPGLTVPVAVAEVGPTALTGPVIAVGAAACAAVAMVSSRAAAITDVLSRRIASLQFQVDHAELSSSPWGSGERSVKRA